MFPEETVKLINKSPLLACEAAESRGALFPEKGSQAHRGVEGLPIWEQQVRAIYVQE